MKKFKINIIILLTMVSILLTPDTAYAGARPIFQYLIPPEILTMFDNTLTIAAYRAQDFDGKSDPEPVYVGENIDYISFYAKCEEGKNDTITCFISDIDSEEPAISYHFQSNETGNLETMPYILPKGTYCIYFVSSKPILDACVIFTKEESIFDGSTPSTQSSTANDIKVVTHTHADGSITTYTAKADTNNQ